MRIKVLISVAATLLYAGLSARVAVACTCVPPEPPDVARSRADAVFAGTVTHVEMQTPFESSADPMSVYFDVSRVWKGDVPDRAIVLTPVSGASCGYERFAVGEAFIVYAVRRTIMNEPSEDWHTSLCSRTKPFSEAAEDVRALGRPTKAVLALSAAAAPGYTAYTNAWIAVAGMALAAGAVVGVWLIARRPAWK